MFKLVGQKIAIAKWLTGICKSDLKRCCTPSKHAHFFAIPIRKTPLTGSAGQLIGVDQTVVGINEDSWKWSVQCYYDVGDQIHFCIRTEITLKIVAQMYSTDVSSRYDKMLLIMLLKIMHYTSRNLFSFNTRVHFIF